MGDRPQESHIRDLEMDLLEKGEANTADDDKVQWRRRELKRKIGREVHWNLDGSGGVVFWIDKERDEHA